ncbi:hypothetical protein KC19_3G043300 [Ceratodon purpureus]|uniref:AAA+ ATPase domain-containing protein n=1 Tax=Ceratodon purpureus TaxID=3225 RepID=A0A8T0IH54_CERPU|nr:hypothetical protein KC19_3G043300 [Ceratodon purpureus]
MDDSSSFALASGTGAGTSFPLHVSFDHGYFLTVRAVQELRDRKRGSVLVGIGGPSGSGKSSLATKIASVLGGAVVAMENYHDPSLSVDDSSDFDTIDFMLLIRNLEDLLKGKDTMMPEFDFQEKKRSGFCLMKAPKSGVVLVEGTYALHSRLRSLLDIRVAVVGGVHFNLLSKVRRDIGETLSLDRLIDSIFPTFRTNIEPDLHHAQIRISNSFVSASLREPYYILKSDKQVLKTSIEMLFNSENVRHEQYIEMYLRPPAQQDSSKTSDWIRMRQCGIRYELAEGYQRIVDKHFIIKPRAEFEVGKTTLGGLLALGYQVAVSFKRESAIFDNGKVSLSLETIDDVNKCFIQVKGTDRKVVAAEAAALGLDGPWITKSYMEMVLDYKGLPRLDSPPLPNSVFFGSRTLKSPALLNIGEPSVFAPVPIRLKQLVPLKPPSTLETWTRSPTKADVDQVIGSWHLTTSFGEDDRVIDSGPSIPVVPGLGHPVISSKDAIKLHPMSETFDFDRGLLLAVQAIQTLLNARGHPVIVGIGGPSGSGKTSFAHKMANIVGCEVISMESYIKAEEVKDSNYDEFSTLDLPLLLKNIEDLKTLTSTRIPVFDFEKNKRSGAKDLVVSEDCGVVILEGVYALHPNIRPFLNLWVAVVGGVHSHLVTRVQGDLEQSGRLISQQEVMTTVFPMFQQDIEPHLVHAHLKISNDFDPVHSPESSMFVLKSSKQVSFEEIASLLDPEKIVKTVQKFTDIYFHLPGLPNNGNGTESNWIRVRNCEGRFALLIREPIREGDFIIQPRVDFDISVRTVAGLLTLGYQAVAYIEATATIYQDDKLLIEVDQLHNIPTPYIQIKGSNKETVAAAGLALNLDGSYTTMPYIEIILGTGQNSKGVEDPQAARLQELVDYVQAQGGSAESDTLEGPSVSVECILEDLDMRIRRLEKWNMVHTVLWTFFMSAFVGCLLYHRSQRSRS